MSDILRGAPLWVYAVFLILTYYGAIACFKHRMSKRSLMFMPAIFVVVSLTSLNLSQGIASALAVYALGLFAGWAVALRFYSYNEVKREGESLVLDGTIKVLVVYWGYFTWHYYDGYQLAMYPELVNEFSRVIFSILGAGLINGLILGRSLRLLRLFKDVPVA